MIMFALETICCIAVSKNNQEERKHSRNVPTAFQVNGTVAALLKVLTFIIHKTT